MPAKAPIYLKPTATKKGKKCRLRDILSPDMISPPLGDFRHTVHIGRGGQRDAFGDMSFLQGRYELLPGKAEEVPPQSGIQAELLRANSTGDASLADASSPVLKNAISLPAIGSCQALTLPPLASAAFPAPSEPAGGTTGLPEPLKSEYEEEEEVEALQTDALLDAFRPELLPPLADKHAGPDVLLELLESKCQSSRAMAKANKRNEADTRFDQPLPYYIGSFRANGSLNSDSSSDSSDGFQEEPREKPGIRRRRAFGRFATCVKQELSRLAGGWADRDSGVEDGRVGDFELEEGCGSQGSLVPVTGSLLSLELDLGPSILEEVLNIMDKPAVKSRP